MSQVSISGNSLQVHTRARTLFRLDIIGTAVACYIRKVHFIYKIKMIGIKLERLTPKILNLLPPVVADGLPTLEIFNKVPYVPYKPILCFIHIPAYLPVGRTSFRYKEKN